MLIYSHLTEIVPKPQLLRHYGVCTMWFATECDKNSALF